MKIGLFVGSFNPITKAHENIVADLLKEEIVDYLYFLPVNSNKLNLLSIDERINIINLIINKQEEILSVYEYSKDGLFNDNVLEKIKIEKNITHLIMGSDLFLKFNTFKNYKNILAKYKIIVIKRNDNVANYINNNYQKYLNNIEVINKRYKGSSNLAKKDLLLSKNRYLDDKVFNYIKQNKLYE